MQGWASERLPAVYVKTSYFAGTKDSEVLSICTKWCKIKPPHSQLLVVWSQHLVWVHPLVELLRCKVSQFHSLLFESLFLGQSHLGYLGSFVVANLWVQSVTNIRERSRCSLMRFSLTLMPSTQCFAKLS